MKERRLAVAAAFSMLPALAAAGEKPDPTAELLASPRVLRFVRIDAAGKTLRYSVDDRTSPIPFDSSGSVTLVASDQVDFVLADYNPFQVEVSAVDTEEDDPNFSAITSFLDTLKTTFLPTGSAAPPITGEAREECPDLAGLDAQIVRFQGSIALAKVKDEDLQAWISGATGRVGLRDVTSQIKNFLTVQAGHIREAEDALKQINGAKEAADTNRAANVGESSARRAARDAAKAVDDANGAVERAKSDLADLVLKNAGKAKIAAAKSAVTTAETAATAAAAANAKAQLGLTCSDAAAAHVALFFLTEPLRQLDGVRRLRDAANILHTRFNALVDDNGNWYPPASLPWGSPGGIDATKANQEARDLIFHHRSVPTGKISIVTVKVVRVTYSAPFGIGLARAVVPESERQAAVRLRQYQRFVPEVAGAVVVTSVRTPVYGVSKDTAGQDIVVKADVKDFDVKPALLANFV
jgi:hypothetical protein